MAATLRAAKDQIFSLSYLLTEGAGKRSSPRSPGPRNRHTPRDTSLVAGPSRPRHGPSNSAPAGPCRPLDLVTAGPCGATECCVHLACLLFCSDSFVVPYCLVLTFLGSGAQGMGAASPYSGNVRPLSLLMFSRERTMAAHFPPRRSCATPSVAPPPNSPSSSRLQVVRVLIDPAYGWTSNSQEMARW